MLVNIDSGIFPPDAKGSPFFFSHFLLSGVNLNDDDDDSIKLNASR